jgi:hypothetical protein
LRDSLLLWQQLWRFLSSGMWRRVVKYKFTEASVIRTRIRSITSLYYFMMVCLLTLCIVKRTVTTSGWITQYVSLLARSKELPMHWASVRRKRKIKTQYSRFLDRIQIRDPILDLLTVSFKILNTQPYQKSLAVSTNYGPCTSLIVPYGVYY